MSARSFSDIHKDMTAQSAHVVTALGNDKPKRKNGERVAVRVAKADKPLGLVFGWAIVCKQDGEAYYDLNVDQAGAHAGELIPEHITEPAMLKAALGFTETEQAGNEMHAGPDKGHYPFVFPLTTDIAKALGIESKNTGLLIAYKPPPDVFAKFADGTYRGFSIEGSRLDWEHHE